MPLGFERNRISHAQFHFDLNFTMAFFSARYAFPFKRLLDNITLDINYPLL